MAVTTSEFKPPGEKRLETQRKTVGGTVSVGMTENGEEDGKKGGGYLRIFFSPSLSFRKPWIEKTSGEVEGCVFRAASSWIVGTPHFRIAGSWIAEFQQAINSEGRNAVVARKIKGKRGNAGDKGGRHERPSQFQ
jgi:hypothetical protein